MAWAGGVLDHLSITFQECFGLMGDLTQTVLCHVALCKFCGEASDRSAAAQEQQQWLFK